MTTTRKAGEIYRLVYTLDNGAVETSGDVLYDMALALVRIEEALELGHVKYRSVTIERVCSEISNVDLLSGAVI